MGSCSECTTTTAFGATGFGEAQGAGLCAVDASLVTRNKEPAYKAGFFLVKMN
jgi:hypothetical protein